MVIWGVGAGLALGAQLETLRVHKGRSQCLGPEQEPPRRSPCHPTLLDPYLWPVEDRRLVHVVPDVEVGGALLVHAGVKLLAPPGAHVRARHVQVGALPGPAVPGELGDCVVWLRVMEMKVMIPCDGLVVRSQ